MKNKFLILIFGIFIFILLINLISSTTLSFGNRTFSVNTCLYGEVTDYDTIYVNGSGTLHICPFNGTAKTGWANISLGNNGNFTVATGGIVNGSGGGGLGGTSVTSACAYQGDDGSSSTIGGIACTANGGGAGGGSDGSSNAESGAGGGGGFGGTGGLGGKSLNTGTQGAAGGSYGTANGQTLFFGSGGGGQSGDSAAVGLGKQGGGGIKINAGAGIIYIQGIINFSGIQGAAGDTGDDSAGGSGSGGHVILFAKNLNLNSGKIFATGARGGAAGTGVSSDSCGGGGGGGGRILYVYESISQTSLVNSSDGGPWGTAANSGCNFTNSTGFKATSGNNGTVFYNSTTWPADTCTAPGSGNWDITCSDACVWTTNSVIPANVTTTGVGILTLNANFTFTGTKQYIFINRGCNWSINRGGGFR